MTNPSNQKRRKWVSLAWVAVLACAAVSFATVGSSKFKLSQTPQIHVVNETEALALVAQEAVDRRIRLQFKNISAKSLNGFVLALPSQSQIEVDTSTGDRVISPGEVQDLEISEPMTSITILAVMYADGSLEGNQITVAQLHDRRSALKAELKRVLGLIVAEAQSPDADISGAFDRLEAAISELPPTAGDGNTPQSNALRTAQDDVTNVIAIMRNRQQRNAHLNQRELIRELSDRIERRIAGL